MFLPLGIFALFCSVKRSSLCISDLESPWSEPLWVISYESWLMTDDDYIFRFIKSERIPSLIISLCICLVVHLYRDGIRRGVAIGQERIFKIYGYQFKLEFWNKFLRLSIKLYLCILKTSTKYRSEPIPYIAYIFYITTYTFSVEVLLKLHESTNEKAINEIMLP